MTAQDSPEVIVNENFNVLEFLAVYGKDATHTSGLSWGYLGGRWGGFSIVSGTLTLTGNSTIYITVSRSTGVISTSNDDSAWVNVDNHAKVYKITTGPFLVTAVEDFRAGPGGIHGGVGGGSQDGSGFAPVVANAAESRSVSLEDVGCYLRFTSAGAKTCTLAAATGFSVSDEVHIANRSASGNVTISASGITLNPPKGGTLKLEPGDTVTVKFDSTTSADVFGSTEAAP